MIGSLQALPYQTCRHFNIHYSVAKYAELKCVGNVLNFVLLPFRRVPVTGPRHQLSTGPNVLHLDGCVLQTVPWVRVGFIHADHAQQVVIDAIGRHGTESEEKESTDEWSKGDKGPCSVKVLRLGPMIVASILKN